jgi:hypothetical protein
MKYLIVLSMSIFCVSCTQNLGVMKPNHIGLAPSVEFEIQDHQMTKVRPKLQSNIDWNL